tara:strand:+ start:17823 stop:18014 length:192 start_codon:yes stop_codon:yes gene_type:complete
MIEVLITIWVTLLIVSGITSFIYMIFWITLSLVLIKWTLFVIKSLFGIGEKNEKSKWEKLRKN